MQKKEIAKNILRYGFVFVFIWFGVTQLMGPASWANLVPTWIPSLLGVSTETIVYINAVFEIVLGLMLALNIYTSVVAFVLGLHLIGVVMAVGLTAIGIRDIGLALSVIALSVLYCKEKEVLNA
jgi:uncharacterized membrane protein YphA (DoxX/SURF4 family)